MAERSFIFRAGRTELVLPVTPASYRVGSGINIEVVNIHELGDVVLAGYGTLATISISCLLPANYYDFASDSDPEHYISQFKRWIKQKKRLRFIVSDTGVNVPVLLENISYGETDGTNDVYVDLTLREHRQLQAVQIQTNLNNKPRTYAAKPVGSTANNYTIKAGDTLSAICRKYYGSASPAVYNRLAKHNGIPNPHLIIAGKNLKIPQPLP